MNETPTPGAESPVNGQSATSEDVATGEPQKGNKEARYRVERNQAREELATANARIERMQRAEVERLASDALSHPADLFSLSGNELADYLTDDGDVDAEKVTTDVAAILAERPGLQRSKFPPGFDPSQGLGGTPQPKRQPTLADLLKGSTSQPY